MRLSAFVCVLAVPAVAFAFGISKGLKDVDRAAEMMVRGDYVHAEPLLRLAVTEVPNDPYAHFDLASTLRALGKNDEAITEYGIAKRLYETVGPRANGPGDIGNCLYGIALAREAMDDPMAAARAWNDYIAYARNQPGEPRATVEIAHNHVDMNIRIAQARGPIPGVKKATRPSTVR